jgi:hypothetical protein
MVVTGQAGTGVPVSTARAGGVNGALCGHRARRRASAFAASRSPVGVTAQKDWVASP